MASSCSPRFGSRLIACLALQRRPISRAAVAGILRPETTQDRAQASLRSTLWRVRRIHNGIVRSENECLALEEDVTVDVHALLDAAHRLDEDLGPDLQSAIPLSWFSYELLPDWYDDWVEFERERFRLIALHALEGMSAWYLRNEEFGAAVECALASVRLEPLRESSHRALVQAHIAYGNASEAVRQYRFYCKLLEEALGVAPSDQMTRLLESAGLPTSIVQAA